MEYLKGKIIHFIGIGGVSMSALACFAIRNGAFVTGSDSLNIMNKSHLDYLGIKYYIGSNPDIVRNADLVVYTNAIDTNKDTEYLSSIINNIPTMPRKDFLAIIAKNYLDIIAISGTHGKTTTTAMISAIMKEANIPFAAHIGGYSKDIGGNYYHSGNDILITEACEYKKSLLSLYPTLGIILNIEKDHPDTYQDDEDLENTFLRFSHQSCLTLIYDDIKISKYNNMLTFGYKKTSDYYADNISLYSYEKYRFDLYSNERLLINDIKVNQYGKHNLTNAICAATVGHMFNIPNNSIRIALENFQGVNRRFELIGYCKGARVYTDYAHHPTEIKALLESARALNARRLIVAYEPHTYSRTRALIDEFKECFNEADKLILLPTYAARECKGNGMDTLDLIRELDNMEPLYVKDYNEARYIIQSMVSSEDIVLIVGAGTVNKLAYMLT